jgi:hypothetical protein
MKRIQFLILLVVSCPHLVGQTRVKPGFNLFSPQQDIEIGAKSAEEIERQLPIIEESSVQEFIGQIGQRLGEVIQGPDFPYQFKVTNLSDINAFALPGGYMYINRGLIEAASTEGELAGVMAHEMAHVALRHGTNQASKAYLAQAGLGVLGGLLGGSSSTGQLIGAVGGFGLNAVFLKFSRSAEEQADIVGAQTLVKAGYDPLAMADFFEMMRKESGGDPGKFEQFFSTHPAPGNRALRIEEETRLLGDPNPVTPVGGLKRVQRELGRLPEAPSMQEAMQKGGETGSTGSAGDPSDAGGESPDLGRIEPPSSQLKAYHSRNGVFRIRYPSNWTPNPTDDGEGVSFVPGGGMVTASSGTQSIIYGMLVGRFDPAASRSNEEADAREPFSRNDQLGRASNIFLMGLVQNNTYLKPLRTSEDLVLDGAEALSATFEGRSPATAELETVVVFTRTLGTDQLIYMILVAPSERYSELMQPLRRILSSLSVDDEAGGNR